MCPELKNVACREARNWLIAAIVAVAYAAMDGSCTPQPTAHRQLVGQPDTAAARLAAKERQAESEVAETVAVYERMSDQERMRGIVYEPVEE
ncbi:hypothetical protein [Neisseria basseii]|uniref:hypothetical protein n=1 Tax=Neisseria basseii TaxID=2830650 RepID=UPI00265A7DA0|nr:hypothetical protein [Neisseria basseii]